MTIVFYEAPHRLKHALADARELLGQRRVVVARELTKIHEEFIRANLSEVELPDLTRGEIVLLIGPPTEGTASQAPPNRSVQNDVEELIRVEKIDPKAALKRVARSRGISKSEAYRQMLDERRAERDDERSGSELL